MLLTKIRISSSVIGDLPVYQPPGEDLAQRFDFGCWTLNVGSSSGKQKNKTGCSPGKVPLTPVLFLRTRQNLTCLQRVLEFKDSSHPTAIFGYSALFGHHWLMSRVLDLSKSMLESV